MKHKKVMIFAVVLAGICFVMSCGTNQKETADNSSKKETTAKETEKKEYELCMEEDKQTYQDVLPAVDGDYYIDIDSVITQIISKEEKIPSGDNVYDIRDFGAVADDNILSTSAINEAVSAAAKTSGTVLISGGTYRSGTVTLQSNITLYIAPDAKLIGSRNVEKYANGLIRILNAKNVTITGGGTISGDGEYFVGIPDTSDTSYKAEADWTEPHLEKADFVNAMTLRTMYRACIRGLKMNWNRPANMIYVSGSENIQFHNIILEASPCWTLNLENSNHITIDHMVMNNNRHIANADGIDIVSSSNVTVSNSFISTADDGIVLKNPGTAKQAMSNINISNTEIMSVMNCFKIGTETYHDISDVTVTDCRFFLTDIYPGACSGISIEAADGAHVTNIDIKNIEMEDVSCPIFICANNRNKDYGAAVKDWNSLIDGVTIENVTADGAEICSVITGASNVTAETEASKWTLVKNVHIKDYTATYRESTQNLGEQALEYEDTVDSVTGKKLYATYNCYPENNSMGDLPAYGFYIRHANGVELENIHVTPRSVDTRENIVQDGFVQNVSIK